jgi:RHS repeat-associated protein
VNSQPAENTLAGHRCDGLHQRVRKPVGEDPGDPDVAFDYYYSPSWQVLQVDKTPSGESAFTYEQYVWDVRYIDSPVCRFRDANSSTGDGVLEETIYYLNDANFNVVALANSSGAVIERYAYSPYGEVTVLDEDYDDDADGASDVENEVSFQGLRRDPYTGLYDNKLRIWNPLVGRFNQQDPLGYHDGMNVYAGYHVMWGDVDPFGLGRWDNIRRPNTTERLRIMMAICVMTKLGLTNGTPDDPDLEARQLASMAWQDRFLIGEPSQFVGNTNPGGETIERWGEPRIVINENVVDFDILLPAYIKHEHGHVLANPVADIIANVQEGLGYPSKHTLEEDRIIRALEGLTGESYEITCCRDGDVKKVLTNKLNDAYCECGDKAKCVTCPQGYKRTQ